MDAATSVWIGVPRGVCDGYAPRLSAGAPEPNIVEGITTGGKEIMHEIARPEKAPSVEPLKSDYPTEAQMKEIWDSYKSGKPGAIAEVLRRRREERKTGAK
jgi:hypothetical protein